MKELHQILQRLGSSDTYPAVLATLVSVEGSSYRKTGARLLLTRSGERVGSISGGCLEEDILERARRILVSGTGECVTYNTTGENDLLWGTGLGCHGVVQVVVERLATRPLWVELLEKAQRERREIGLQMRGEAGGTPSTHAWWGLVTRDDREPGTAPSLIFQQMIPPTLRLLIFGAGDDAKPLVRMAREMGWSVTVCDPRPHYATRERFPEADSVLVAPAQTAASAWSIDSRTAAVIMTHHYVHDLPLLEALIGSPACYLGLLGPRQRADRLLNDLAARGVSPTAAQRTGLRGPVGLDLGGDAPEAVALAIVAEIQATLSGRDARPLRERQRPIHQ